MHKVGQALPRLACFCADFNAATVSEGRNCFSGRTGYSDNLFELCRAEVFGRISVSLCYCRLKIYWSIH